MAKIWQLLTGLGNGGAERVAYEIAMRLDDCAVVSLTNGGIYAEKLREAGREVFELGMTGKWQSAFTVWKLRKLLRQHRPALLHTHLFHANIAGRFAALNLGVPVIATCHICEMRFRPLHFTLDRITARYCAAEVCVAEATKDFQRAKTGLPEDFFHTISNGVDLQKFVPTDNREALRMELNFPDAPVICGFLGRLVWQKGADILLNALAEIPENTRRNFAVVIGGDGPDLQKLQAQMVRLRLDNVYFLGEQSAPEKFLAACDFVVMPSRYEGFGLVAVEAQATGASVIASDLSPLREIIRDRETGIFVPVAKPAPLALAIRELVEQPQLRTQRSANARACAANFSIEKMLDNYRQLYAKILSRNPA